MRPSYNAQRAGRVPRPVVSRGASVPPPVGGWDAVSPVAAMPPDRAIQLDNWFPQLSWVELRRGFIPHSNTRTGAPVETIAAYQGVSSSALFAVSDGTIFNVDVTPATSEVTGLSNSRFQYTNFAGTGGNFLYMVNGADDPQYFDGSAWSVATITGEASGADFITVTPHKNRLWFSVNGTSDAAYLDVDSIQGASALFPLGGNWSLGGFLMQIASWSLDGGNGPEDYIAFISSRGQVSVYSGTDPDTDFALVGTYTMGAPIGRRCITKVGADVAVICIDGLVPLSKALIFDRAAVAQIALTQRIQRVMNQSARDFKDNFGWQIIGYPKGTRAILNVPIEENSEQQQYVMNTLSGAWCRFTGMNFSCWEVYNDNLYGGSNDGLVHHADTSGSDFLGTLNADMRCAFNYYDRRGNLKRWTMCRPQLTTDQQVLPGLAFNVDFQEDAALNTATTPFVEQSLWDEALWDVDVWAGTVTNTSQWQSVTGMGYCASIRMTVSINSPITTGSLWGQALWGVGTWEELTPSSEIVLQVNGFDLQMCDGAFI